MNLLQIILILIVLTLVSYEVLMTQMVVKCIGESVLLGTVVGAIMGDVKTGMLIGGTMQLMSLGLAGYGGASVPNYRVGTTVGTAIAISNGGGLEVALVVGVPAATLGVQLDVFAKMLGAYWLHIAEGLAAKGEYKKTYKFIFWSNLLGSRVALTNTYPALLFLLLGSAFVDNLLAIIPAKFISSLTTCGNVLPALGMAILLKYMPVKSNLHWLVLGFVLSVYFNVAVLPIALIGGIIAVVTYQRLERESKMTIVNNGGVGDE